MTLIGAALMSGRSGVRRVRIIRAVMGGSVEATVVVTMRATMRGDARGKTSVKAEAATFGIVRRGPRARWIKVEAGRPGPIGMFLLRLPVAPPIGV